MLLFARQQFLVRTDQQSLKYLLEQWIIDEEYSKWLHKLMGYDFEIPYKPRSTNSAADALSRLPDNLLSQLSASVLLDFKDLSAQVAADSFLSNISQSLHKNPDSYPNFITEGAHLPYKVLLVILSNSLYIPLLLHEFHHGSIGGHAGIRRTYAHLAVEFYWRGI